MTESEVMDYVKTQLGASWVDVEVGIKDIRRLITMALDKLAPYYEGHRFIQASGKIIDLSAHQPLAIEKVYNTKDNQTISLQEYTFGGSGVILFDTTFMQRLISYQSYKMLWNEIQYQKGMNSIVQNKGKSHYRNKTRHTPALIPARTVHNFST